MVHCPNHTFFQTAAANSNKDHAAAQQMPFCPEGRACLSYCSMVSFLEHLGMMADVIGTSTCLHSTTYISRKCYFRFPHRPTHRFVVTPVLSAGGLLLLPQVCPVGAAYTCVHHCSISCICSSGSTHTTFVIGMRDLEVFYMH